MSQTQSNTRKVAIIGLDGATFKVLRPLIESDELPFLSYLLKNSAHGVLETFYPTLSPMEWAAFYTGVNPARLGIFALNIIMDNRCSSISWKTLRYPALWDIVNFFGYKAGVINVPATYPPKPINGFMITGLLTPPGKKFYYPDDISEDLKAVNYKVDFEMEGRYGYLTDRVINKYKLLQELLSLIKARGKLSLRLLKKYDISLFIINFKEIDTAQHLFWKNKKVLSYVYKLAEKYVKEIIDVFEPEYIIIMSDHGFHEAERYYFFINRWLEIHGILSWKRKIKNNIMSALLNIVGLTKLSPLLNILPEKTKEHLALVNALNDIDTEKSLAYANRWGIFIMEKGRLREILRKYLLIKLKEIRDFQGNCIFKEIYFKEDLYWGDFLSKFPDIIFVPNSNYMILPTFSRKLIAKRLDKLYLEGAHKSDNKGILIVSGKNIKKGKIKNARIIDLAPTALYLMHLPIPSYMDGKILDVLQQSYPIVRVRLNNMIKIRERAKLIKVKLKERMKIN